MQIILFLLACTVSADRISKENFQLKATNRLLVQTLRALTEETAVQATNDHVEEGRETKVSDIYVYEEGAETLGSFPAGCHRLSAYQLAELIDEHGYATEYQTCLVGEVWVAEEVCCPLDIWLNYPKFNSETYVPVIKKGYKEEKQA